MADLAAHMVRAQLAASLLVLAVLILRRPVRRWAGPRIAYGLWILPLVAAVAVLLPTPATYVAVPAAPTLETLLTPPPAPAVMPPPLAASPAPAFRIDPWQGLLALWLAGVVVSLAWLGLQQARYLAFVRQGAAGPAVVGFWRPRVVLPADFEDRYAPSERDLILAHETAHLRRQDPRAIAAALLLRSLAWFNPLAGH